MSRGEMSCGERWRCHGYNGDVELRVTLNCSEIGEDSPVKQAGVISMPLQNGYHHSDIITRNHRRFTLSIENAISRRDKIAARRNFQKLETGKGGVVSYGKLQFIQSQLSASVLGSPKTSSFLPVGFLELSSTLNW